ncbi:MAG: glycosyltransferase [Flavobacteriales bacterium]|nr:glycosyltransferase [Flavobacteriales bacterium]MDW8431589.1 glycosyltransferase [Flavobacteriales bacterium]
MPRILRITNRFNLGGPTYNVALLTKYLAPEYETLLVGARHEPGEESSEFILKDLGVAYQILPSMGREIHPFRDIQTLGQVMRLIRRFRPHIVHTHASKAGAVGRLAARLCGVPVVLHTFHGHVFHGYFGPLKTSLFKNLERFLARISDAVVAISPAQKDELVKVHKICPASKVHVVPLGFQLKRFLNLGDENRHLARQKFRLPGDAFIIGSIGRLAPIKNHALLLRSFAQARAEISGRALLVVVGDGPLLMENCELAENLGLRWAYQNMQPEADIFFTGWIKYVEEILPAFDVMALSSLNEGTPVSLIEAQAAGIPVVSTEVGGVRDVIVPGFPACLVSSGDPEAMSRAFKEMYLHAQDFKYQASLKRTETGQRFSAERLASDMRSLYEQLLDRKNPVP